MGSAPQQSAEYDWFSFSLGFSSLVSSFWENCPALCLMEDRHRSYYPLQRRYRPYIGNAPPPPLSPTSGVPVDMRLPRFSLMLERIFRQSGNEALKTILLAQQFPTLFASRPRKGPKNFPRPQLNPEWIIATPRDPKIFLTRRLLYTKGFGVSKWLSFTRLFCSTRE